MLCGPQNIVKIDLALSVLTKAESNLKEKEFLKQKRKKIGTIFENLLGGWICHQLRWDGSGDRETRGSASDTLF